MRLHLGHTLLESTIVIAILGILATAAAPAMIEFAEARRAQSFAALFHTELNLARNTAIMRGQRAVLCRTDDGEHCVFAGPWTRGFMSFVDVDGNGDRDEGEALLRVTSGDDFHQLRMQLSTHRRNIVFRPDGRGGGTNLTATVCDARGLARRSVVISVAGRVRMGQPPTGAGCF